MTPIRWVLYGRLADETESLIGDASSGDEVVQVTNDTGRATIRP